MHIYLDKNNSLLIVNNKATLKQKHLSQLKFWGFESSEQEHSIWQYVGPNNIPNICLKLNSYFKEKNISFTFSDQISKILQKKFEVECNFARIKNLAAQFKAGNYDIAHYEQYCTFLDNITKNTKRELKKHQKKASYHHYLLKNSANFSVPGSGKTSVILSVYEKLRLENEVNLLYVIGPTSCFNPWQYEFEETLGRHPKYKILSGGNSSSRQNEYYNFHSGKSELVLTSFQTFCRDYKHVANYFNHKSVNALLVIDEAHYMKQIGGCWAESILKVGRFAKYKIILTGTPCPKSYIDLFNLFDFLWDTNNPLKDDDKSKIEFAEKTGNLDLAISTIKNSIDPLFYRVKKSDLGLLEQNFHAPIIVKMNKYEKLIYQAIAKRIHELSYFDKFKSIDILLKLKRGRIIRLRQLVSYAKLLSSAIDDYDEKLTIDDKDLEQVILKYDRYEVPSKVVTLNNLVLNIQKKDQKILVWSNFVGTIKMLESFFNNNGHHCKSIYGKTPIYETDCEDEWCREKIVNNFLDLDSDLNILIANPAACAEAISLHKTCFHAIYYDLSYNCAQYLQSLDRIHRVGGSEKNIANYYFLQYANTIDLDIMNNLHRKQKKMYAIIEDDYSICSLDMSEDDNNDIEAYDRFIEGQV